MLYAHTEVLALPALSLPCVGFTKALKTDTNAPNAEGFCGTLGRGEQKGWE